MKTIPYALMVAITIVLHGFANAQFSIPTDSTTPTRSTRIKFDPFTPLIGDLILNALPFRISLESEHPIAAAAGRVAIVVDMDVQGFTERYPVRFRENGPHMGYITSNQYHVGLYFGGRVYPLLFCKQPGTGIFIEPQFGLGFDRANAALNGYSSGPTMQERQWAPSARVRAGAQWAMGKDWGFQVSADAFNRHYLYPGKREWTVLPELDIWFRL